MFSRRAFSMAGPAAWNSLPDYLQDPSHSFDSFCRDLKTFLVLLVYTNTEMPLCTTAVVCDWGLRLRPEPLAIGTSWRHLVNTLACLATWTYPELGCRHTL